MTDRLFAYGTLGPGGPNEHVITKLGGTWQRATVIGVLRKAGWGSALGYPGLDIDPNGEEINGHVYSSERLSQYWSTLDEFEGSGYQRITTQAQLDDGNSVSVYVYVLANAER